MARIEKSVRLENVVLNFPHLYREAEYEGKVGKFESGLIISKDSKAYKRLKKAYDDVRAEAVKSKALTERECTQWERQVGGTKGIIFDCESDPDRFSADVFQNAVVTVPKNSKRPTVVDRSLQPIYEEDEEIYSGAICNAFVTVYAYNKTYKGIGIQLEGVQKVADGERLDGYQPKKADDMFDKVASDDEYD